MLPNFPTRPVVKNVFHFEISVEKPELLKGDAILGEAQILRGLEWRLECVHKENPEKMDISLAMPQPLHGLYFMDCSYTVAVKRGDEMVLEHKQEKAETLSVLSTHLLRSVDNPTALFGDEDRILVTVDVHVFRSKRIDFSKPSEFSDVALKLDDDTVLHLSKPLLSIHSPFFHHLLLSHFKPKNVVELHHVDLDSLLVILYPLYGIPIRFEHLDVEGLLVESLELASRLRLDVALHGFETFIARLEKPTIFRFIRYADRLGMILLMHEILAAANKLELRLLYDQLDDSFSVQTLEEFVEHLLSMD